MFNNLPYKSLRQRSQRLAFSAQDWVMCLRRNGYGRLLRCSHRNVALCALEKIWKMETY
jgi:hypothetical protein